MTTPTHPPAERLTERDKLLAMLNDFDTRLLSGANHFTIQRDDLKRIVRICRRYDMVKADRDAILEALDKQGEMWIDETCEIVDREGHCPTCGAELECVQTHEATLTNPPEYEERCPDCDGDGVDEYDERND